MRRTIAMPPDWDDGIAWAIDSSDGGLLPQRRMRAIARLKGERGSIREPRALLARSSSLACSEAERLATDNPDEWRWVNKAMVTHAAYGLRYVELITDREIPCTRPLPSWLQEWTTS